MRSAPHSTRFEAIKEAIALKALEREQQRASLVSDLQDMYGLDPADRYSFVQDVMEQDETDLLPQLGRFDRLPLKEAYIQDFASPGTSGLRPSRFEDLPPLYISGNNMFADVHQCRQVEVDTTDCQPYLRATMSECSLLIARSEARLWVAHLGLSQHSQMRSAMNGLQEAGFKPSDLTVVASVGPQQQAMNDAEYSPRLANTEAYQRYGINQDQILTFEYDNHVEGDTVTESGLCDVVVGKDGTLVTTYDIDRKLGRGAYYDMRYTKHPDTVLETFHAA